MILLADIPVDSHIDRGGRPLCLLFLQSTCMPPRRFHGDTAVSSPPRSSGDVPRKVYCSNLVVHRRDLSPLQFSSTGNYFPVPGFSGGNFPPQASQKWTNSWYFRRPSLSASWMLMRSRICSSVNFRSVRTLLASSNVIQLSPSASNFWNILQSSSFLKRDTHL